MTRSIVRLAWIAIIALGALVQPASAHARHHATRHVVHHVHAAHWVHRTEAAPPVEVAQAPQLGLESVLGNLFGAQPVLTQPRVASPEMVAPRAWRHARNGEVAVGSGRLVRATWYGPGRWCTGCGRSGRTASGERFTGGGFTMALNGVPFNTRYRVCAATCAVFRVNDRGHNFDLARGGAFAIGVRTTTGVRVTRLD